MIKCNINSEELNVAETVGAQNEEIVKNDNLENETENRLNK